MTKEQLVSDIILRVTRGKPSDDLELEPDQVAHWIDLVLGAIVKQSIEESLKKGDTINPVYINHEECISPRLKNSNCADCQNNIFIELCDQPISLSDDRGVLRVTTQDGLQVDRVSLEELDVINKLTFSKPSLVNLIFHREKNKLYIHGVDHRSYKMIQLNVWYIPEVDLLSDLDDDDEIGVDTDILGVVSEKVEEIARRQLYQSMEDEENDAEQDMNQSK